MHTCIYAHTYMHWFMHTCLYTWLYMCVCLCVCVHLHILICICEQLHEVGYAYTFYYTIRFCLNACMNTITVMYMYSYLHLPIYMHYCAQTRTQWHTNTLTSMCEHARIRVHKLCCTVVIMQSMCVHTQILLMKHIHIHVFTSACVCVHALWYIWWYMSMCTNTFRREAPMCCKQHSKHVLSPAPEYI